jgi:hypothetical protein
MGWLLWGVAIELALLCATAILFGVVGAGMMVESVRRRLRASSSRHAH